MAGSSQSGRSARPVSFRGTVGWLVAAGGQSRGARPSARRRPQRPGSRLLGLCPIPRRRILPKLGPPSRILPSLRRSPHPGLGSSAGRRREAPELPRPNSNFGSGLPGVLSVPTSAQNAAHASDKRPTPCAGPELGSAVEAGERSLTPLGNVVHARTQGFWEV